MRERWWITSRAISRAGRPDRHGLDSPACDTGSLDDRHPGHGPRACAGARPRRRRPGAVLVLGHGAGGGVAAPDLVSARDVAIVGRRFGGTDRAALSGRREALTAARVAARRRLDDGSRGVAQNLVPRAAARRRRPLLRREGRLSDGGRDRRGRRACAWRFRCSRRRASDPSRGRAASPSSTSSPRRRSSSRASGTRSGSPRRRPSDRGARPGRPQPPQRARAAPRRSSQTGCNSWVGPERCGGEEHGRPGSSWFECAQVLQPGPGDDLPDSRLGSP